MSKLKSTQDYRFKGLNCLVYGESGVGKTTLASTVENLVIISAESGLLSLADHNIPVYEVTSFEECTEAYKWFKGSKEAQQYSACCVDSISDLAEVLLAEYKKTFKDGRQAYGKMNDDLAEFIRRFRDIQEKHVYFIATQKRLVDEGTGLVSFVPSLPGQTMLQNLPYFFDLVLAMRHGKGKDGQKTRYLQTAGDLQWVAKDRSGKLDKHEPPHLGNIIKKVQGVL